jgi:hypothetical protein
LEAAAAVTVGQQDPEVRGDYLPIVNITAQLDDVIARLKRLQQPSPPRRDSPMVAVLEQRHRCVCVCV